MRAVNDDSGVELTTSTTQDKRLLRLHTCAKCVEHILYIRYLTPSADEMCCDGWTKQSDLIVDHELKCGPFKFEQ